MNTGDQRVLTIKETSPNSITVHSTYSGSGDEGTAMLEIIHDLAPDADLYFAGMNGYTSSDMVSAIEWMVNQGCDIIVDDLLFFNEPMFEDGPIAEAAQDAVDSGVLYVTSAGNNAELHYQGDYIYSSGGYHDFDPGAGLDQTLMFYATYQSRIYGTLQWSDEFGNSGNDYDLSLFG